MATPKKSAIDRKQLDKLYDARSIAETEFRNATDDAQRRSAQERKDKANSDIDAMLGTSEDDG